MSDDHATRSVSPSWSVPAPAVIGVPVADSIELFPVRRVYCVGRNYAAHIREMGGNEREPPFFFQKPADAVVITGSDVAFPVRTVSFQHEVELVLAIGMAGTSIAVDDALRHVFGYAVGVDLTRRDLQLEARNAGRPWESGKSFDQSAPIGAIVRATPHSLPADTGITLHVNGKVRQQAVIGDMIWSCNEIIGHLSTLYRLEPGDLIYTGTPAGVGDLQPGDRVEGRVDGIGSVKFSVMSANDSS